MKNVIFALAAVAALGGTFAIADVLLPSQVVVSGDDAKHVNAKIAEITGAKPQEIRGAKFLSANAQVSCSEFSNGQVSCKINILE